MPDFRFTNLLLVALWLAPSSLVNSVCAQPPRPVEDSPAPSTRAEVRLPFELVRTAPSTDEEPTPSGQAEPMLLERPEQMDSESDEGSSVPSPTRAVTTVVTSLSVVLGLFALVVWFTRRVNSRGNSNLPGDVIETLGRAPLNARQEMHLVRVGNKLLLLSVTATSAETLTEITDPVEIERLSNVCRRNKSGRISESFRDVLNQLTQTPNSEPFAQGGRV